MIIQTQMDCVDGAPCKRDIYVVHGQAILSNQSNIHKAEWCCMTRKGRFARPKMFSETILRAHGRIANTPQKKVYSSPSPFLELFRIRTKLPYIQSIPELENIWRTHITEQTLDRMRDDILPSERWHVKHWWIWCVTLSPNHTQYRQI